MIKYFILSALLLPTIYTFGQKNSIGFILDQAFKFNQAALPYWTGIRVEAFKISNDVIVRAIEGYQITLTKGMISS